jgi:alpha-tubulin suppressor-like RCC1 family protein
MLHLATRLLPTRIRAQHFDNAKIISAAGGVSHSAAVPTEEGTPYTWGHASGLRDADKEAKWVRTCIAPNRLQGARVGRCHYLLPIHALVFAMGTHSQLGSCAVPLAMAT